MMKKVFAALSSLTLFAASMSAPAAAAEAEKWTWHLSGNGKPAYRGVANMDAAGMGAGSMLYPAPGLAGLVAAVITHGVLVEASKSEQKTKLQEDADRILIPYQAVLDALTQEDLVQRAFLKSSLMKDGSLVAAMEPVANRWIVKSTPSFAMTQDQTALILDHIVSVYAPGNVREPVYESTVRVVSTPQQASDLTAFWTADNGEKLKEESAGLLAESMDLVVAAASDKAASNANPQRTFRYREGRTEKMERAQLVSERCDRKVILTLRGTLMSIPASQANHGAAGVACENTTLSQK